MESNVPNINDKLTYGTLHDRIIRLEDKSDKILDKTHHIDKTLVRLTGIVDEHHKRSLYLEKLHALTQEEVDLLRESVHGQIEPLENHVHTVKTVFWFSTKIAVILATIGTLTFGALKVFFEMKHFFGH